MFLRIEYDILSPLEIRFKVHKVEYTLRGCNKGRGRDAGLSYDYPW